MFYTITGEFINKKKNIIETFSDEENVHLKMINENENENKVFVAGLDSTNRISLIEENASANTASNLQFTVKSRNGKKYLSTKKYLNREREVIDVDDNNFLVLCFVPKQLARSESKNIINIVMASESTSSTDTIKSIDDLIANDLVLNNLNTYDNQLYLIDEMKREVDIINPYTSNTSNYVIDNKRINIKEDKMMYITQFFDQLPNYIFVSESGQEKKDLEVESKEVEAAPIIDMSDMPDMPGSMESIEIPFIESTSGTDHAQINDHANRYNQMRLDMCTKPEVFCPPGYKCITSNSWNTLLGKVGNLDSDLEQMNILDGDN